MTIQKTVCDKTQKIKMLEASWKDAQKKSEDERLPIGVREAYDEIAQQLFIKLSNAKKQIKVDVS